MNFVEMIERQDKLTYEEASNGIKTWLGCMRKSNEGNDFANEFIDCAEFMTQSVIREAVEKQIPKKPVKSVIAGFGYDCPNCGAWAGTILFDKFCNKCGQALDWSGKNDG